ncbi:peptidylprolyl isomerase [Merismopedia glauca CCAP 1448/3]|uniref:peptidylprolyl isomerase n=1 Tax=Merismopedia glauca CCAP 1448/3 TaxID=1296344 RepID=A0A2T1BXS6_9CYAN|nr:peptidylprolyl isomerase [Merismopedia glauca CCAP 1448/3]
MSALITVDKETILQQAKLSAKIPEMVEGILSRQIISQTATDLGVEIATEELQEAADRFRLMNQLHDSEETYKWLEKHGISLDEFEEMINYNLVVLKLGSVMFKDKIEAYFAGQQLDYLGAAIYEVILEDEDEAMELFYQIQAEETSFHEIAVQHIQDVELRRKGGYRGILYRKDLKPEVSAAIFAANPPQIIKPITTSLGVHLIWVEEIIKPQLDNRLTSQIGLDLFSQWLKQKMDEIQFELAID